MAVGGTRIPWYASITPTVVLWVVGRELLVVGGRGGDTTIPSKSLTVQIVSN